MFTGISHHSVYVLDQDQALDFYCGKLGFEVSADVDLGFMRWLTIALPAQPDRQIMLEVPGAPFVDEETAAQLRDLLTKGALGAAAILTTDDCRATYEDLRAKGVEFTEEDAAEVFAVYADGFAAGTTSSMQRDLAAGRPSELEDQTGTVVARAGPGRWVWLSRCAGSSIGRSRPVRRSLGPRHEPAGDREEMGRDESGVNPGRGLLPEAVDADP